MWVIKGSTSSLNTCTEDKNEVNYGKAQSEYFIAMSTQVVKKKKKQYGTEPLYNGPVYAVQCSAVPCSTVQWVQKVKIEVGQLSLGFSYFAVHTNFKMLLTFYKNVKRVANNK